MKSESRWGNRFYETLSKDLRVSFPDAKGFSKTNIKNARQFYELLPESEIDRQVVDQLFFIPWGAFDINCLHTYFGEFQKQFSSCRRN